MKEGYFGKNYYSNIGDVRNDMRKGWFGRATAYEICEKFDWDTDWIEDFWEEIEGDDES